MTKIFFVSGVLEKRLLDQENDAVFISCNADATAFLQEKGMKFKIARDYALPDSNKRAVDFLNEWSQKKLGDKTIKDAMLHENFSFWWRMKQWFFYSFMYCSSFASVIFTIDFVHTVITKEKPNSIVYLGDKSLLSCVIPVLANRDVILNVIDSGFSKALAILPSFKPFAIKQFFRLHSVARRVMWSLLQKDKTRNLTLAGVLAVCSYHWRTIDHPAFSSPVKGDAYISPIFAYLPNVPVALVDATQREYVGFEALKEKAKSPNTHVLLEQYLQMKDFISSRNLLLRIRRNVKEISQDSLFEESWNLDGINLWQFVAPQFWCYFNHRLEGHILDFFCVKRMIAEVKPKVVVYPCEGGDLAYVFFYHAKENMIPCVAIQHGTMTYSSLTIHAKEELSEEVTSLPRPAVLLVYGQYYKDLLMTGKYPEREIQIMGNLRYDHFAKPKESKRVLAQKYGIDSEKKVIMYLTQILPDVAETTAITRSVFCAAKKLDLPLIVKQHPGEMSDALYHSLAKEYGIKPFITKTASTLELLQVSDVLIGCESTLDYEAMILGVPVIITHFNSQLSLPFVKEGAAVSVTSVEQVTPSIEKTLLDQKLRAKLANSAGELVRAHCFKIDGKAAYRASCVIKRYM